MALIASRMLVVRGSKGLDVARDHHRRRRAEAERRERRDHGDGIGAARRPWSPFPRRPSILKAAARKLQFRSDAADVFHKGKAVLSMVDLPMPSRAYCAHPCRIIWTGVSHPLCVVGFQVHSTENRTLFFKMRLAKIGQFLVPVMQCARRSC